MKLTGIVMLVTMMPWLVIAQDATKPADASQPTPSSEANAKKEGQSAEPKTATEPKKEEQSAEATSEAPSAADTTKKPAGDGKATPQRFIPSEQVRSDFDVSFPVDI